MDYIEILIQVGLIVFWIGILALILHWLKILTDFFSRRYDISVHEQGVTSSHENHNELQEAHVIDSWSSNPESGYDVMLVRPREELLRQLTTKPASKREALERRLQLAIAEEMYEEAAQLRDKIKRLG